MSRCKLRTPWPIHFKLRTVIGIDSLTAINTGVFPDSLKVAQVTPIHKKNIPLNKSNYRPVSVLPILSKVYKGN